MGEVTDVKPCMLSINLQPWGKYRHVLSKETSLTRDDAIEINRENNRIAKNINNTVAPSRVIIERMGIFRLTAAVIAKITA